MTGSVGPAPYAVQDLITFLRRHTPADWPWPDRLKTVYRPYIAPLDDLLAGIPAQSRVYDVGCGNGALLALVAAYRQPAAIGGVDVDPGLVDRARQLLQRVAPALPARVCVFDGTELPEGLQDFDTVLLVDVLHHVPPTHQHAFLTSLHDRMAPGATLHLKDIDADSRFWCLFNRLHDRLLAGAAGHEPSAVQLVETLQQIGFNVDPPVRRRMLVYPHFTVRCRRRALP
jgi:SAM-dependent methyltransferase